MKITEKKILSEAGGTRITQLEVASAPIASKVKPGQFIVLMVTEKGERIPLTVVDKDKERGTVTLIFQEVGLTTKLLGRFNKGDCLFALVGPLGHPTEIKNYGKVILVGGGVGIAEILPVAKALKEEKNFVTTIIGAKRKELLILEKELKSFSDEFYITTDDGSSGKKGFTTDILKELLSQGNYDLVYAVGPIPMMKKAALVTKDIKVKTLVSLNPLMVDATGMCGVCRVTVGGEVKFSCVDGPEFDAQLVNWDELAKRNNIYEAKEKHLCNLYKL